jgi:hypothetical protein
LIEHGTVLPEVDPDQSHPSATTVTRTAVWVSGRRVLR